AVDPEDPQAIADLAATGVTFGVATYVVGLPGVDQTIANQIAMGGGTDSAILVGTTNVEVEFQNALAKVRGSALPCSYEIPAEVQSGEIGLGKVNVEVTPEGGMGELIPQDPSCAGDGWYFDDAVNPTAILLCPATCNMLKQTPGIRIEVVLGCTTFVN
ncbi:MAG: VWA domain-containing protein, partial [Myxococcales bacterium]|nr:VWA domain-containing protein [Myxococcales bacterium]